MENSEIVTSSSGQLEALDWRIIIERLQALATSEPGPRQTPKFVAFG